VHRRRCRTARLDDARRGTQPSPAPRRLDARLLIELVVPAEAAGSRLDRYLAAEPAIGSRAAAERAIETGAVIVDGLHRSKSHRLHGGERITFAAPKSERVEPDVPQPAVAVAYEDGHLLVVDKPAGVVVHPGAGHRGGTLAGALLAHGARGGEEGRAGIVHRLDRDTSGLLVVAKSEDVHRRLQRLVRRREVEREYTALVRGRPRSRTGRIDAPIGRDRNDPTRQSLDTDRPRDATTHFALVELLGDHALLHVRLETGRTHQIRVHLAAIDLPVVGDRAYGVPGLGLARQFLHASRLTFPHPISGERIDVESPLPADLQEALSLASTG
jgi:23S rRNA pseudouridine1911/1915/1917 synthase